MEHKVYTALTTELLILGLPLYVLGSEIVAGVLLYSVMKISYFTIPLFIALHFYMVHLTKQDDRWHKILWVTLQYFSNKRPVRGGVRYYA